MVESDIRYYQRRAREEMIAADRAVTEAARQRRLQLASMFARRLSELEPDCPSARTGSRSEAALVS